MNHKKLFALLLFIIAIPFSFAVMTGLISVDGGMIPGSCPDGYVVQNTTTGGVDCVSVALLANLSIYSGNQYGYVTGGDTFHVNITALNTVYNSTGIVGLTCLNGQIAEFQSGQWTCGTDSSGLSAIYSGNNLSYITGGDTVNVNETAIQASFNQTYVPYTGATQNVNLGNNNINANNFTLQNGYSFVNTTSTNGVFQSPSQSTSNFRMRTTPWASGGGTPAGSFGFADYTIGKPGNDYSAALRLASYLNGVGVNSWTITSNILDSRQFLSFAPTNTYGYSGLVYFEGDVNIGWDIYGHYKNLNVSGNVTANNLCYSNGTNCVNQSTDFTGYNTTNQLYTLFVNQTYFDDNITQYYLASNPDGYISSYTETDPLFTAANTSLARTGTCLSGYVVQNTTNGGVECVSVAALANISIYSGDDYTYITGQDTLWVNLTTFDARYLQSFMESDPVWTAAKVDYNTTAQLYSLFVNQTYYDANISLYYPVSNPAGYINASQVPQTGINESFANSTYARLDSSNQPFTGNISAIKVSPSNTSWGQCWNGTDYITGYLVGVNCV